MSKIRNAQNPYSANGPAIYDKKHIDKSDRYLIKYVHPDIKATNIPFLRAIFISPAGIPQAKITFNQKLAMRFRSEEDAVKYIEPYKAKNTFEIVKNNN